MKSRGLQKLSIAGVFMCCFLFVAMPAFGTLVNLSVSGSYDYGNVIVSDKFGTDTSSNPYIYLDFTASGGIVYDYDLNFDLWLTSVYPGESITPQFTFNSGSLTANQDLDFKTMFDFGFDVDMPFPVPDIDLDASLSIPNLSYSWGTIIAKGSGSIDNSSSNASILGDGVVKIETPNDSMVAWTAGVDIIAALAETDIPYVSEAMYVANSWPFSLDLIAGLGMDIYRKDTTALIIRDLPTQHVTGMNIGDTYTYSTTLDAYLYLVSNYQYGGSASLTFDGNGFDRQTLLDIPLGSPWDVNQIYTRLDFEIPVSLEAEVISYLDWLDLHTMPFEYHPPYYSFSQPGVTSTPLSSNHPELHPVPEPSTMLLLVSGLAGLFGFRKKLKK